MSSSDEEIEFAYDYIPPAKKKLKKSKSQRHLEYFGNTQGAEVRYDLYQQCVADFTEIVKDIEEKRNAQMYKKVREFIEAQGGKLKDEAKEDISSIPILFLSANLINCENSQIFTRLRSELKTEFRSVTLINSREFRNAKQAYLKITNDFTHKGAKNFSIYDFECWHQEDLLDDADPNLQAQPLIVLIEDLDYFSIKCLKDLFSLLSCSSLPLLFIIGTRCCSKENVGRYIPANSGSKVFRYSTFENSRTSDQLHLFFNKILEQPKLSFLPDSRVFQYLQFIFDKEQFSFNRLKQIYKLCLSKHFENKESILCVNPNAIKKHLKNISKIRDDDLSFIPVEQTQRRRSTNSRAFNEKAVNNFFSEFWIKKLNWFIALNLLFNFGSNLPANSVIGNSLADFFTMAIEEKHLDVKEDKDLCPFAEIKKNQKKTLITLHKMKLKKASQILNAFGINNKGLLSETIYETCTRRIDDILKFINDLEMELKMEQSKPFNVPNFKAKMNHDQLKRALMEAHHNKNKKHNTHLNELMESFIDFLGTNLRGLKKQPFYKSFVFDGNSSIVEIISSVSCNEKHSIVAAISNPYSYLKCRCCKDIPETSISNVLPDISIVFKLIQEQVTTAVNYNVICKTFECVLLDGMTQAKKRRLSQKKLDDINNTIPTRFAECIAQLKHVGILRKSRRVGEFERVIL